jgi:immunity protein, SdpI family
VYLVLLLIPLIDPGRANYDQFAHAYAALRLALILFMAVTYAAMQAVARGYPIGMAELPNLAVGAILLVVGNLLAKVRPNWFIGIRTPWTLSSKTAWDRTHRLGAWLFVIAGILVLADAFVPLPYRAIPLVALPVGAAVVAAVYSYFVWRTATDKIPPAGTMPA